MAWCLTGNKPLPEPMLTKMPEAIVLAWSIGLMPHQRQAISSTNPDLNTSMESSLAHWYLSEKDNILQTTFQMHLYGWKRVNFNLQCQTTLNELMDWRLTDDKPSFEPILTKMSEAMQSGDIIYLGQHFLTYTRPDAKSVPGHYLKQSGLIVNGIH